MRGTIGARLLSLAAFGLLTGCWTNNFPVSQSFIRPASQECRHEAGAACPANLAHVFADANGTLYPSNWAGQLSGSRYRQASSLLNGTSPGSTFRRLVEADEERQLRDIAEFGRTDGRIFILVHGYNNNVVEADNAYRLIQEQLDSKPEDRILRFYWDGLEATDPLGAGGLRIWFYAAGNSQLVGSRALRNVLRQFSGKQIYLIGHSRGTSVILSALGNPVYDPGFFRATQELAQTWGERYLDLLTPPPLESQGNRLHVIVAAPAVDRIDFCDARHQPKSGRLYCEQTMLRPLGENVESFRYTVNRADPVLRKFVGLESSFNPTRLGVRKELGEALSAERYGSMFKAYEMTPAKKHAFTWYVQHKEFGRMLCDANIGRKCR